MLKLVIDQDIDHVILRALLLRVPDLDFITAYQAGKSEVSDPELLKWAALQGRAIVTHDRRTMPNHATQLITRGEPMAGLIVISRKLPVGQAVADLEIIVSCSEMDEWKNVIKHLPL